MKADYLNGTGYTIIQPPDMYHFSSDTELLGRFMRLKKTDSVLDIGCATGALLLYAAHQGAEDLCGIDLFADVIRQAEENLQRNGVKARLLIGRVQDLADERYDAIVCNPPYFNTADERLKNSSEVIRAARHEEYLRPDELFAAVRRLLKDSGTFYLVHRSSRLTELLLLAEKHGLQAVRMRIAYASAGGSARTVLLAFRHGRGRELVIERPVFLDQRETFADLGKETQ